MLHAFAGGTASDGGLPEDGILINLGQLYGGAQMGPHGGLGYPVQCGGAEGCGTLFKYPRF